ncbi:hypothetical protein BIWAKO_04008 [Bosea sp. BIWAKO-01]|nr:hypothetical protein BIWAKO_04008 [Bosea sp. BIWAKO-01]
MTSKKAQASVVTVLVSIRAEESALVVFATEGECIKGLRTVGTCTFAADS